MSANKSDPGEVVQLYRSGLSQAEIGQQLGLSQTGVGVILRRNGVRGKSGPRRRYSLNEAYFSDVTTRDQAYWLGFLAADGFLIKVNNAPRPTGMGVRLAVRDATHLQLLADCLDSDAPVRTRGADVAEVRFYSVRLTRDLERHGIVQAKTFVCAPWNVPDHLAAHYWRGAVDGDGYVSTRHEVVYVGTLAMCEAFAAFAKVACGTTVRPLPNRNIWKVQVCGRKQIHALLLALYGGDGTALARKRERALAVIADCERPRVDPRRGVSLGVSHPCKAPGCDRTSIARELCNKHYQQLQKYGDALKPEFVPTLCGADGCVLPQVAKGYCPKHYAKWRRHGDPLAGRPYYRLAETA